MFGRFEDYNLKMKITISWNLIFTDSGSENQNVAYAMTRNLILNFSGVYFSFSGWTPFCNIVGSTVVCRPVSKCILTLSKE
ncbi:hypothetical protein T11_12416 [Trichinella zimbabwensis]|uniref:Uncharacterized protein n=1 Tax=Trichinella zimbabwensis TaxID=268475 RepID=A0A0V1GTI0_9BILA|nr:hypothetical protein T11_12416 [Trichinella zimbabwensis]